MGSDWEDDSDSEQPPKKVQNDSDEEDWDKSEGEEPVRKQDDSDDDDDWDADKAKPVPIVAATASSQAAKGPAEKPKSEAYVPLADPAAEKARQRRLQEESDARLGEELFSGFVKAEVDEGSPSKAAAAGASSPTSEGATASKTDAKPGFSPSKRTAAPEKPKVKDDWDEVNLDTQDKVIKVMKDAMAKIEAVETKAYMKGCNNQFLLKLLLCVADKISLKEAQDLEKKVKEIIRVRKVETAAAQAAKTKINAINKNTKFDVKNALDERYGAGDEDWDEDEEWGEGDWGEGDWAEGNWEEGKW